MEPFEWNLRVGARDKNLATVFVRNHQFAVGAPLQFDQEYPQITSLEYVLGAIGSDVANGLFTLAKKRRVEVDNVEAVVHGAVNNPLTYLDVVGEEGHPGIERIRIQVYASSVDGEEKVRRVWDEVIAKSPLVRTLQPVINLELTLKVVF